MTKDLSVGRVLINKTAQLMADRIKYSNDIQFPISAEGVHQLGDSEIIRLEEAGRPVVRKAFLSLGVELTEEQLDENMSAFSKSVKNNLLEKKI